jgi:hypothetical protein
VLSIRALSVAFSVFSLLWNAGASAADYTVSYAFETPDGQDAGRAMCKVDEYCRLPLEKWDLVLSLAFYDSAHKKVTIRVDSTRGSGCCYFSDGALSVDRNIDSLIGLYVYAGHARRKNEYIMNTQIGILHLLFANVQ